MITNVTQFRGLILNRILSLQLIIHNIIPFQKLYQAEKVRSNNQIYPTRIEIIIEDPLFSNNVYGNRHLESFESGTAYIYKFSLLVSVICVTFARLQTLHHVA